MIAFDVYFFVLEVENQRFNYNLNDTENGVDKSINCRYWRDITKPTSTIKQQQQQNGTLYQIEHIML